MDARTNIFAFAIEIFGLFTVESGDEGLAEHFVGGSEGGQRCTKGHRQLQTVGATSPNIKTQIYKEDQSHYSRLL